MLRLLAVLFVVGVVSSCTTRDFGTEADPELRPETLPVVEGKWIGEHTWAGGESFLRLVLDLSREQRKVTGTAVLTGTVTGRLTATGEYDAPDLHLTLTGAAYDERFILPGTLTPDGTRILAYFRGAGVDFELTLRRLREDE